MARAVPQGHSLRKSRHSQGKRADDLGKAFPVARKVVVAAAREKGAGCGKSTGIFDGRGARGDRFLFLPGIALRRVNSPSKGSSSATTHFSPSALPWLSRGSGGYRNRFERAARRPGKGRWPGRYTPAREANAGAWVDGAHNPAAAAALARELANRKNDGAQKKLSLSGACLRQGHRRVPSGNRPVMDGIVVYPLAGDRAASLSPCPPPEKGRFSIPGGDRLPRRVEDRRRWAGKTG